mgnify:CR=1 FL=1
MKEDVIVSPYAEKLKRYKNIIRRVRLNTGLLYLTDMEIILILDDEIEEYRKLLYESLKEDYEGKDDSYRD